MAISRFCHPNCVPVAIVLTDGDPKAIDLLQENLINPFNQIDSSIVRATHLLWKEADKGLSAFPDFYEWYRTAYTTICSDDEVPRFDSIVAGDVLYKEELPKLFFATAFSLLSKNADSSLWLCHIPRHGVQQSNVIEEAKKAGFVVTIVDTIFQNVLDRCSLEDIKQAVTYRMYIDKALL
jgi:hypothetical protein